MKEVEAYMLLRTVASRRAVLAGMDLTNIPFQMIQKKWANLTGRSVVNRHGMWDTCSRIAELGMYNFNVGAKMSAIFNGTRLHPLDPEHVRRTLHAWALAGGGGHLQYHLQRMPPEFEANFTMQPFSRLESSSTTRLLESFSARLNVSNSISTYFINQPDRLYRGTELVQSRHTVGLGVKILPGAFPRHHPLRALAMACNVTFTLRDAKVPNSALNRTLMQTIGLSCNAGQRHLHCGIAYRPTGHFWVPMLRHTENDTS